MANSTRKKPGKKPAKPYPTFPLTAHPPGRWCKKIRGKLHYFGRWGTRLNGELTTVDNPAEAALNEYLVVKDDLHAGRTPRPKSDGITLAGVCNPFLKAKEDLLDSGELSPDTFRDYFSTCKRLADFVGRDRAVDDLNADDFTKFRAWLSKTKKHGVHQLAKGVRATRMVFKFAHESELINKPVRFVRMGLPFQLPAVEKLCRHRSSHTGNEDGTCR